MEAATGEAPVLLAKFKNDFSVKFQHYLDKSTPHTVGRWLGTGGVVAVYFLRVYFIQGFYIVTYGLGIYLLNLLIGFLSPIADPELEVTDGPSLPMLGSDEFKPFIRRLPEFKFWYAITKAFCVAFVMTFFSAFDVPVFWPILLCYWIVLFVLTMKRQILHMIKYKYIPFNIGKQTYVGIKAPARPRVPTAVAAMATHTDAFIQQKRALRSQVRRALKAFPPDQRSREDIEIQRNVLESPWFKSSKGLCAYISCEALREVDTSRILTEILKNPDSDHDIQVKKKLYVPRIEDKNSRMRMLKILSIDDLVANSMNILEPSPLNAEGIEREDVMLASQPVDIFLLPGVAFDRQGRRLGRGGGYYDVFLKKYQEFAVQHSWKKPLLVALAYSVQILEDDVIPMTSTDFPIDALVSASEVIRISPAALERM